MSFEQTVPEGPGICRILPGVWDNVSQTVEIVGGPQRGSRDRYGVMCLCAAQTTSEMKEESGMPRPNRGSIDVRAQVDGAQTFYLRLTVDGRRHRVRLGSDREGWTIGRAMVALEEQLAEIRAGTWQRAELAAGPGVGEDNDLTFRAYASSWLEDNMLEWRPSTISDVKWRSGEPPAAARRRGSPVDV